MESVSAYLAAECADEIDRVQAHPWLLAAADGTLPDEMLGTWARQDVLWAAEYYGDVFAAARSVPGLPAPSAAAFAWLEESLPPETDWFNKIAAEYPAASGAEELWPDWEGYGAWMLQAARRGPEEALVVMITVEGSYHEAFKRVRDASPRVEWAQWAGQNWAGEGFTRMMANQAVGLDDYLGGVTPDRLAELVEVARHVYRWEGRCFTALTERRGWDS
jgi:thiaminase